MTAISSNIWNINYTESGVNTSPENLKELYECIKYYLRMLSRKAYYKC